MVPFERVVLSRDTMEPCGKTVSTLYTQLACTLSCMVHIMYNGLQSVESDAPVHTLRDNSEGTAPPESRGSSVAIIAMPRGGPTWSPPVPRSICSVNDCHASHQQDSAGSIAWCTPALLDRQGSDMRTAHAHVRVSSCVPRRIQSRSQLLRTREQAQ